MNLTDNEIMKALECCDIENKDCVECPLQNKWDCHLILRKNLVDFINRKTAENKDLFYKLTGVMHSVDKWLEGDELKQNEVQRACTMREKTLRIAEQQITDNERLLDRIDQQVTIIGNLELEVDAMRGAANPYKMHYEKAQAEIEKYQHIEKTVKDFWSGLKQLSAFKNLQEPTLTELLEYIEQTNVEAIKEFAERVKEKQEEAYILHGGYESEVIQVAEIDNAVKELEDYCDD